MLPRWQLRSGEKRGDRVGLTKKGKGTKCMVLVDGQGTPLGVHLDTASSAEVCLAEATLDAVQLEDEQGSRCQPERVIADRAFDSNRLRRQFWQRGIEPVIPARKNNNRATDQDGRKLRRYARRWLVERTIAWLGNFRRLLIRYDRFLRSYAGFFHLACVVITLKMVLKLLLGCIRDPEPSECAGSLCQHSMSNAVGRYYQAHDPLRFYQSHHCLGFQPCNSIPFQSLLKNSLFSGRLA